MSTPAAQPNQPNQQPTRLSRRLAVLWALAAGAVLLAAGAQQWIGASGLDGVPGTAVTVSGNQAAAVVPAMALVGLAGGAALSIARRVARTVIAVLLILAGAAAGASAMTAVADPARAAASVVAQATGTTAPAVRYDLTLWPWVTVVVAVLLALCGVTVLTLGRRWSDTTRRYERPAVGAGGTTGVGGTATADGTGADADTLDEIDVWDELSRGGDPT